jgi:integrase
LLPFSGLRLREATALRWRNVDWDKELLTGPGTKSASSFRHIPLFPPLENLLREMRARREDVLPDAPVLLVSECKGALRSACSAVGITKLTHHDLRHLFATMCIQSKVDIPTVARWLGHSDGGALAMRTYGHFQHEHSQSEAQKVTFGLY